jgi:hypothetical protein
MSSEVDMTKSQDKVHPSLFIIASIFFGFCIITFTALQWILIDILTPFCIGPVILISFLCLILMLLASVIYIPFRIKKHLVEAFAPLVINVATCAIIWFVPFNNIWLDIVFSANWQGYNEVVQMVERGEIGLVTGKAVQLPQKYQYLSTGGGDIIIEKQDGVTSILFFTYRGVLDNYSGYVYRSDNSPPPEDDLLGPWKQVMQKKPHWFFCGSY